MLLKRMRSRRQRLCLHRGAGAMEEIDMDLLSPTLQPSLLAEEPERRLPDRYVLPGSVQGSQGQVYRCISG
eukprot:763521-Hanusia_phi.AAC.13